MTNSAKFNLGFIIFLFLINCGEPKPATETLAQLSVIHSSIFTQLMENGQLQGEREEITGLNRILPSTQVCTSQGGRGELRLDTGLRIIIDKNSCVFLDKAKIELKKGRFWIENLQTQNNFKIFASKVELSGKEAGFSVSINEQKQIVNLVNGEITYKSGTNQGILEHGNTLEGTSAGGVEVKPTAIWEDWTSGFNSNYYVPEAVSSSLITSQSNEVSYPTGGGGQIWARVPNSYGTARIPLAIRKQDINVIIDEDMALTKVDQEFFNARSDTLEGIYEITLPPGAIIKRFGIDRDGQIVWGKVFEKQRAAQQYQQQVYQGSPNDPSLLEWIGSNRYRAHIYPIEGGKSRRIVIEYISWLEQNPESKVFIIPFNWTKELPSIGEFSLNVDFSSSNIKNVRSGYEGVIKGSVLSVVKSDFRPTTDFYLELLPENEKNNEKIPFYRAHPDYTYPGGQIRSNVEAQSAKDFFLVKVPFDSIVSQIEQQEEQSNKNICLALVVDRSSSINEGVLSLEQTTVEAILNTLSDGDEIGLWVARENVTPIGELFSTINSENREILLDNLNRSLPGGATDLQEVLSQALSNLPASKRCSLVYIGDGKPSIGELDGNTISENLKALNAATEIYTIGLGWDIDSRFLNQIVRGRGRSFSISNGDYIRNVSYELISQIARPTITQLSADFIPSIEGIYPREPIIIRKGESVDILGRIQGDPPQQVVIKGNYKGKNFDVKLDIYQNEMTDFGDITRRWATGRLNYLFSQGEGAEAMVELGTRYGLITPWTSIYVPSRYEVPTWHPTSSLENNYIETIAYALLTPVFSLSGCTLNKDSQQAEEQAISDRFARLNVEQQNLPSNPVAQPDQPANSVNSTTTVTPPSGTVAQEEGSAAQPVLQDQNIEGQVFGDALGSRNNNLTTENEREVRQKSAGLSGEGYGGGRAYGEDAPRKVVNIDQRYVMNTIYSAIIDRHKDELDQCYSNIAMFETNLAKGANSDIYINSSGYVSNVAINGINSNHLANCITQYIKKIQFPGTGENFTFSYYLSFSNVKLSLTPSLCSDASKQPLDVRIVLWRERLRANVGVEGALSVWREAKQNCEVPQWGDKQALLRLILSNLGIAQQVDFYYSIEEGVRNFVRNMILQEVRTPDELQQIQELLARQEFPWEMWKQLLPEKMPDLKKVDVLIKLVHQFPENLTLKRTLLTYLEKTNQRDKALSIAYQLRIDPGVDVPTLSFVGQFFFRSKLADEAKRTLSEIAERYTYDPWARKRLGDLYRTYGWSNLAIKEYYTLTKLMPSDDSAKLYLAVANWEARRYSQGLSLWQSLLIRGEGGNNVDSPESVSFWARKWLKFSLFSLEDEIKNNPEARQMTSYLAQYWRRTGLRRNILPFEAIVIWSHPDAVLDLKAQFSNEDEWISSSSYGQQYLIQSIDSEYYSGEPVKIKISTLGELGMEEIKAKLLIITNQEEQTKLQFRDITLNSKNKEITIDFLPSS